MNYSFLIHFILILLSAKLLGALFQFLRIPSLLGELSAGILLGPSFFHFVMPSPIFNLLAEIGVVLLLFEVGLHTDLSQLLSTGKKPIIVASMGFILPLIFSFALIPIFHFSLLTTLFIGGTLSATSIGISVRLLKDLHQMQNPEAQIILGAAILDDVFGIFLLTFLYTLAIDQGFHWLFLARLASATLLFMFLAPIVAKIFFWFFQHYLPRFFKKGVFFMLSLLILLIFTYCAHIIGLPLILGGFVAGVALSKQLGIQFNHWAHLPFFIKFNQILKTENRYFNQIENHVRPLVFIFAPFFFVMVGASFNLHFLEHSFSFWSLLFSLSLIAFVAKFFSGFFIKESPQNKKRIGLAMIPRGEVGLIFASMGLGTGLLSNELYACLILVVALTTFLPPFLLKHLY